jgi:transposase
MMGVQAAAARLYYDFCLDDHVPADHQLRGIDRHLDFDDVRNALKPFYSNTGRPSVDPELMIRMLLVGYCMGIRSERRLCAKCISISPIAGFFRRAWVVNSVVFG